MSRPPKPFEVLKGQNKKSRRTKGELREREKQEASLATGSVMKMYSRVASNAEAKAVFTRTYNLLKSIKKHDALGEPVLNRYALLTSECISMEKMQEKIYSRIENAEKDFDENPAIFDGVSRIEFYKVLATMQGTIAGMDRQIQTKRRMLFDIEKEMLMTVAAQLRSIPKKPEKPDKSQGGFAAFQSQGSIRDV